jgi:hypothetical protein
MQWTSLNRRRATAKRLAREERQAEWHPHFTWWPTKVGQEAQDGSPIMAWLEWIECRVTVTPTRWLNGKLRFAYSYTDYRRKGYDY